MPSGKRFDVLVTATGNGTIPLRSVGDQSSSSGAMGTANALIATVNIQGNQKDVQPATDILPSGLIPMRDLNLANVTNHRVLNFSSDDKHWIYTINNKTFNPHRIDEKVKLGTLEEWKLVNLDNGTINAHPFHIHVNDFQVVSVNGKPYDAHGYQDTVVIPTKGEIVIRIPFDDFVGKTVYHCHLMFHGDYGMMGAFDIVK
jgi:FtsP/CotA-like multicopper oxidase with cupredoxin domain